MMAGVGGGGGGIILEISSLRSAFHLERHHLLIQFRLLLLCARFDQRNQQNLGGASSSPSFKLLK